jgi:2-oxoglutarate dehydrogenase complex dehydrogenase (E1) component-like enzyme
MVTSSKKIAKTPAVGGTPAKKPAATKAVATTSAIRASAKKTAATPVKKTSVPSVMKTAPILTKKMSSPKKIEAPADKPAATAKSAPVKSIKKNTVTPEERYKMIATAAFFRAERRGFATGNEAEDWSTSEAEIDATLNA